jgi:hypothetical protein
VTTPDPLHARLTDWVVANLAVPDVLTFDAEDVADRLAVMVRAEVALALACSTPPPEPRAIEKDRDQLRVALLRIAAENLGRTQTKDIARDALAASDSDRGKFYDRKGNLVTEDEHYAARDRDGNLVAWTRERGIEVSTVHVGVNCVIGAPRPMIFETSVFGEERHYATEEEARAGHEQIVKSIRDDPKFKDYC